MDSVYNVSNKAQPEFVCDYLASLLLASSALVVLTQHDALASSNRNRTRRASLRSHRQSLFPYPLAVRFSGRCLALKTAPLICNIRCRYKLRNGGGTTNAARRLFQPFRLLSCAQLHTQSKALRSSQLRRFLWFCPTAIDPPVTQMLRYLKERAALQALRGQSPLLTHMALWFKC